MKILLTAINSKYIHSNLAVYSLKAYHDEHMRSTQSGQYHSSVEIAEYTINQYTSDILASIYEKKPDVVAISCYIWNIAYVYEVAVELKKVLPDTDIWLGGPEVTYDAAKVLQEHRFIDGVMIGEGEETFLELCRAYESHAENECSERGQSERGLLERGQSERGLLERGQSERELSERGISEGGLSDEDLLKIRQIVYRSRRNSEVIQSTPMRPLLDMDCLPFVYQDMAPFENKIIYYESSRGCPFGCSYCLSSVEKSVRFRSLSKVLPELQMFMDRKVAQVKFVDRTFNCNHDRTMEILRYLKEHDNGITNFHFEIAADLLREDEIALMSELRPGLIQLEIGVQTSNPITIHEIDRKMDLSVLSGVVNAIHEQNNIHQHLDLIAGLPYEGIESFQRSFDYVYRLKPQQLQLGFLKVLKGSKMHRQAEQYHIVYQDKPPYEVLYTQWLSYEEVLALKNVESIVDTYYNSRQYVATLDYLIGLEDSPYEFFRLFAEYYKRNGYFEVKHTKITRYEILYHFIKEYLRQCNSDQLDIIQCEKTAVELLIYDLYLRENVKTRPHFAMSDDRSSKAEAEEKKKMRVLYQLCNAPKTAHLECLHQTTLRVLQEMEPKDVQITKTFSISDHAEYEKQVQTEDNMVWLLFDYEQRDHLNYNAQVTVIELQA